MSNRTQLPSAGAGAKGPMDEVAPRGDKRETCCSCGGRWKSVVPGPFGALGLARVTFRCRRCDRVEHEYTVHGHWWWRYRRHPAGRHNCWRRSTASGATSMASGRSQHRGRNAAEEERNRELAVALGALRCPRGPPGSA